MALEDMVASVAEAAARNGREGEERLIEREREREREREHERVIHAVYRRVSLHSPGF